MRFRRKQLRVVFRSIAPTCLLLCAAQSGIVAFGQRYGNRRMSWKEKLFDYDNQLGVKAGIIFGITKAQFNGIDYGTVVTPVQATQL